MLNIVYILYNMHIIYKLIMLYKRNKYMNEHKRNILHGNIFFFICYNVTRVQKEKEKFFIKLNMNFP